MSSQTPASPHMDSWEVYFRQNTVSETRALAKSVDRKAADEQASLQAEVGDKHADILALAQRVDALKLLVYRQESDLAAFISAPEQKVPRRVLTSLESGQGEDHTVNLVTARLMSVVDRSIVQRKYVLAARALFLADMLELPSSQLEQPAAKLERKLQGWLVNGTQVSQNLLHACMIFRKWSPATFVAKFLVARLSQIRKLLAAGGDILGAFTLVDSTLFIYNQLVSDLCKSRLSQRRLAELPEFADQILLFKLLQSRPQAAAVRAFPSACYESSGEPADSAEFLHTVAADVQETAFKLFGSIESADKLTNSLARFVVQAQNALSAESGMGRLLEACEPPFSARFEAFVKEGASLAGPASSEAVSAWKRHISELRSQKSQLARLSRTTKSLAPAFSERLAALEAQTAEALETNGKAAYSEERARLLAEPLESLEQTRSTVEAIAQLDSAYASVGGSLGGPPQAQYEQLAKFIVEHWQTQPVRAYLGSSLAGTLFELSRVMDETLINVMWTPAVLDILRRLVLQRLQETSPELAAEAEQALQAPQSEAANDSETLQGRSALLLKPLVH